MVDNVQRLAAALAGIDRRVHTLETVPQLPHSSIDDFALPVYDADGNLTAAIGKQADGTWGAPPLAGPVPPEPKGVSAAGTSGAIEVTWDGAVSTGKLPLDWAAVEILANDELIGAIHNPAGGRVLIPMAVGTYRVTARSRSQVPVLSDPVTVATVTVLEAAETLAEKLAADLADGVATASKMNTISTAGPDDVGSPDEAIAQGFPEGALWTTVELVDGALVETARFQVVDGTWQPVGLDASRIVTGSIDAGLIDAVSLSAYLVSAGLIRTGSTGQRLEMTSQGLVLWLLDEDGRQFEGVRIGPQGATLITVGDTLITPTSVNAPSGAFRELAIGGRPLVELLWALPQGVAGFATSTTPSAWDGTGAEVLRLQAEAVLRPDRRYSITVDPHYVELRTGSGTTFVEFLRWEVAGSVVTTSSPVLAHSRTFLSTSGVAQSVVPLVGWIETSAEVFGSAEKRCYFAISTRSAGGRDARLVAVPDAPLRITIRDEGPRRPATGRSWMEVGTPAEGTAQAPAAVAETRQYTSTYPATGSTTYWSATNAVVSQGGDAIQGSYDGTTSHRRHAAWWFPPMTGDLAGATITAAEVFIDNKQTYSSAGGVLKLWAHDGTNSALSALPAVALTPGRDVWVPIPEAMWAGLRTGGVKGFMALTTTNSTTDYLRNAGGAESAQIRISYTK